MGIDSFDDYYDPARKRANVAEVRASSPGVEFHEADICAPGLDALFTDIDAVVHLAALAGVRASIDQADRYFRVNLLGTINVLEAAVNKRVPHVVFGSTSSVYGATNVIPFVETDSSDRPLAPYPASKRSAELIGHSFHHLHGLDFTALRFFTVYGPRGRPDMMPYKVLRSIVHGDVAPLFGGGKMRRDWTFVGDIARGIVAAVDKPMGYAIINIGRGQPIEVSEFIAAMEKVVGRKAQLRDEVPPPTEIDMTFADLTKAKALLDYEATTSFVEGIERFWAWYQAAGLAE